MGVRGESQGGPRGNRPPAGTSSEPRAPCQGHPVRKSACFMNLKESTHDEKAVTGKRWANVKTSKTFGRVNYLEEQAVRLVPAEPWLEGCLWIPALLFCHEGVGTSHLCLSQVVLSRSRASGAWRLRARVLKSDRPRCKSLLRACQTGGPVLRGRGWRLVRDWRVTKDDHYPASASSSVGWAQEQQLPA